MFAAAVQAAQSTSDQIVNEFASNFDLVPYEEDFSIDMFDDYGIDDLGDAFGSFDFDFDR